MATAAKEKTETFVKSDPALRLLVFAPFGRDATLVSTIAAKAGIRCDTCPDPEYLKKEIEKGAGAAILTEEAITPDVVERLKGFFANQPPWSDFPLIVLTGSGVATMDSLRLAQQRAPLGNISLLERPVRVLTLLSTVNTALRARQRQYEIRDHLIQRQLAAEELRESQERLR